MSRAVLVAFAGLPGVGKSTVARLVAQRLPAAYVRIDSIEQAMRSSGVLAGDVGPAGYIAAYGIAEGNLRLGIAVVADSVNPLPETRTAWRQTAMAAGAPLVNVEVVCSDQVEHQRRATTRQSDVPGLAVPTWPAILQRDYRPWIDDRLQIDSAVMTPEAACAAILQAARAVAAN
jgi:predicted kinase